MTDLLRAAELLALCLLVTGCGVKDEGYWFGQGCTVGVIQNPDDRPWTATSHYDFAQIRCDEWRRDR